MSSSRDAGYAADDAMKTIDSKCPKAKDGKHDFKTIGSGPSSGGECKNCGTSYYWK
jgi:hypothetical protein